MRRRYKAFLVALCMIGMYSLSSAATAQESSYYEPTVTPLSDTDPASDHIVTLPIEDNETGDPEDIDKGLPNSETVAGNEETSGVLGANTSQQSQNSQQETLAAVSSLQETGNPTISSVLTGILIVFLAVATFKYSSRD